MCKVNNLIGNETRVMELPASTWIHIGQISQIAVGQNFILATVLQN